MLLHVTDRFSPLVVFDIGGDRWMDIKGSLVFK